MISAPFRDPVARVFGDGQDLSGLWVDIQSQPPLDTKGIELSRDLPIILVLHQVAGVDVETLGADSQPVDDCFLDDVLELIRMEDNEHFGTPGLETNN